MTHPASRFDYAYVLEFEHSNGWTAIEIGGFRQMHSRRKWWLKEYPLRGYRFRVRLWRRAELARHKT